MIKNFSNLVENEKKNQKVVGTSREAFVKKLNVLVKKLLNFKEEKPKRAFIQLEIRRNWGSIFFKAFTDTAGVSKLTLLTFSYWELWKSLTVALAISNMRSIWFEVVVDFLNIFYERCWAVFADAVQSMLAARFFLLLSSSFMTLSSTNLVDSRFLTPWYRPYSSKLP